MKRLHVSTSIGLFFLIGSLPLFFFDYRYAIGLLTTGAYFLAMKEVSKYTSWFQFSIVFISSFILGFAIEYPIEHTPWLLMAVMVAGFGSIGRIVMFRIFSYTGYSWFEPTMLVLSILLYAFGNLTQENAMAGWIMPMPVIVFSAMLAHGVRKDKRQLLAYVKQGGYKVAIGKKAPEFELPDQNNNMVKLSDFADQRNMLLIFVRGDWCPGCHMMLRTYEKNREKFASKNIMIMAIGPDPVGVNQEMVKKIGVDYKVLSDEGQKTAMRYGVQLSEYDHDFAETYEEGVPLPASFLIDKKGIVRYVSRPDRVGEFLNPSLIFPIIDKIKD